MPRRHHECCSVFLNNKNQKQLKSTHKNTAAHQTIRQLETVTKQTWRSFANCKLLYEMFHNCKSFIVTRASRGPSAIEYLLVSYVHKPASGGRLTSNCLASSSSSILARSYCLLFTSAFRKITKPTSPALRTMLMKLARASVLSSPPLLYSCKNTQHLSK